VDNPETLNFVKAGASVPVEFQLGGDQGLDIVAAGSLTSRQIVCQTNAVLDPITATETAGGGSLSYDTTTQTYTYVWKTEKGRSNSCRESLSPVVTRRPPGRVSLSTVREAQRSSRDVRR
jgi:hypothetical protein